MIGLVRITWESLTFLWKRSLPMAKFNSRWVVLLPLPIRPLMRIANASSVFSSPNGIHSILSGKETRRRAVPFPGKFFYSFRCTIPQTPRPCPKISISDSGARSVSEKRRIISHLTRYKTWMTVTRKYPRRRKKSIRKILPSRKLRKSGENGCVVPSWGANLWQLGLINSLRLEAECRALCSLRSSTSRICLPRRMVGALKLKHLAHTASGC